MNGYVARVNELVAQYNPEMGPYAYVREHQFAFVYRTAVVSCEGATAYGSLGNIGNEDPKDEKFSYRPLAAKFTSHAGDFEFGLMTVHTSPASKAKNTAEVESIPDALDEMATYYSVDKVGCLGDFNADGTYYSPGTVAQGWLNGFPTSKWFTLIPNGTKTTVAASNKFTYDRIQLSHPFAEHFTGNWGVVRFSEYYDVTQCEGPTTTVGTEGALSDHYPVWAEFYTSVF
jgi:hypothetical protein